MQKQQSTLAAFFKWATIGFLGFFALLLLFAGFFLTRMFPLMELTKDGAATKFFGGSLQVHDFDDKSAPESEARKNDTTSTSKLLRINGSLNSKVESVNIQATSGRIETKHVKGTRPGYECEVRSEGGVSPADFIQDPAAVNVAFEFNDTVALSWCVLTVPASTSVQFEFSK